MNKKLLRIFNVFLIIISFMTMIILIFPAINTGEKYMVCEAYDIFSNSDRGTVQLKKYNLTKEHSTYIIKGNDIHNKSINATGWDNNQKVKDKSSIYIVKNNFVDEYYYFTDKEQYIKIKQSFEKNKSNIKSKFNQYYLLIMLSFVIFIVTVYFEYHRQFKQRKISEEEKFKKHKTSTIS